MELIPIVEETLVLKGFAERNWAEKQNLCHLTTLLIPVVRQNKRRLVQVQIRDNKKSFPGCRDVFGGHVAVGHEFWPFLLGKPFDLAEIVAAAAVREANEELRVSNKRTGEPYIITEKDLRQVGRIGEASWNGPGNVERSTIFLVPIRDNHAVHPMDDIKGVYYPVENKAVAWEMLQTRFQNNPQYAFKDRKKAKAAGYKRNRKNWQFADGAARILREKTLFTLVRTAIEELKDEDFR